MEADPEKSAPEVGPESHRDLLSRIPVGEDPSFQRWISLLGAGFTVSRPLCRVPCSFIS